MITLKDGTQLTPVEIPNKYKQLAKQINTPEMQSYLANQTRKQFYDSLSNNTVKDISYRNPNEGVEQLLEEGNSKQDQQIEVLMRFNSELQTKLDDAYIQLKQLNDKDAIQTGQIKELRADLREESLRRELAETKLNIKDWKVALIALGGALIALGIEHWKDIYDFILSLIG